MAVFSVTLGILAALLHAVAYIIYNIQAKFGRSTPNPASWSVWAFFATLNAFSFREMSGDTVVTLQFFTGSVACIVTFFYVLLIGKFSKLKFLEWFLLFSGLVASIVWWQLQSATWANMIALAAFVISFIPTFEKVRKNPLVESPLPWVLWTVALTMTTFNLALRDSKSTAYLMPVTLILAHASIAFLSRENRKEQYYRALENAGGKED